MKALLVIVAAIGLASCATKVPSTYPLTQVKVRELPKAQLEAVCLADRPGCQYSFKGEKTCHVVLLKSLPPDRRRAVLAHELNHCKYGPH